jgi:hypothetical protein
MLPLVANEDYARDAALLARLSNSLTGTVASKELSSTIQSSCELRADRGVARSFASVLLASRVDHRALAARLQRP